MKKVQDEPGTSGHARRKLSKAFGVIVTRLRNITKRLALAKDGSRQASTTRIIAMD